jgi:hypothetical protein
MVFIFPSSTIAARPLGTPCAVRTVATNVCRLASYLMSPEAERSGWEERCGPKKMRENHFPGNGLRNDETSPGLCGAPSRHGRGGLPGGPGLPPQLARHGFGARSRDENEGSPEGRVNCPRLGGCARRGAKPPRSAGRSGCAAKPRWGGGGRRRTWRRLTGWRRRRRRTSRGRSSASTVGRCAADEKRGPRVVPGP